MIHKHLQNHTHKKVCERKEDQSRAKETTNIKG